MLYAGGVQLRGKQETLLSCDECRAARGRESDGIVGRDDGDIDQRGELIDELRPLVYEGSRVFPDVLEIADLLVQLGNLFRQLIDLPDGLLCARVEAGPLRRKAVRCYVERSCHIASRSENVLPQR